MAGDSVQLIKERLTIVDVVSPYMELQKAGKNYKGRCPFHQEKTPSFMISPDRGLYHCYGCSAGGDMFTFIQEIEGIDFKGALKILADKAGVELVAEDPKKKSERDRQYDVLNEAAAFFEEELQKKAAALTYLTNRGVKPETITKWRIGYAPGPPHHGWREGKDFLVNKGFTQAELLKAGLIKGTDTGKEPYDLFRDRVMFPIFDPSGRPVAFSGRILEKDSEAPKYVNSPETELFNKSEILYGYDKAKQGIRHYDFSLIVEGQFDVVMTHQAGYHNAVAVSGTALTAHHVMLLQRLSNRVVLALDADRAGIAAVKRAAELMLARGMDVKVAKMPDDKDPADIIHESIEEFKKIIGHSTHVIEYLLDILESQNKDERTFKLKVREEILSYVVKIPNRIDQEHFENIIAERLKTTKDAIHFEVERLAKEKPPVGPSEQKREPDKREVTHEDSRARRESLLNYLVTITDLYDGSVQNKLETALTEITGQSHEELKKFIAASESSALLFTEEDRFNDVSLQHQKMELIEKLNELQQLTTKDKLKTEKELLKTAETSGQSDNMSDILVRIAALQKQLVEVKYTLDLFSQ